MTNFAVIENNIVENIIIADTKEIAETITGKTCVTYTQDNPAAVGYTYANGVFAEPVTE
jgi:hypothetical protein